jgi:hypothetical protein
VDAHKAQTSSAFFLLKVDHFLHWLYRLSPGFDGWAQYARIGKPPLVALDLERDVTVDNRVCQPISLRWSHGRQPQDKDGD